jgi:hypothetical protein
MSTRCQEAKRIEFGSERKPKTIIVKVLVIPVIPAVVLSGNPESARFLKA